MFRAAFFATVCAVSHQTDRPNMADDTGGNTGTTPASPATFAAADWSSEASPASDSSQQTTTPSAAEQPTPVSEQTTPAGDDRSPFIPRARFDEVNTKLSELKAWREQHAWVEDAQKRAAFDQAVQIGQQFSTDRVGYARALLSEMLNDPQTAPAIRSEAARLLGTRAAAQPEAPQFVNVELADGRVVPMPLDPQAWLAHERQKWQAELDEKFAPALQTADELKAAKEQFEKSQEAQKFAAAFGDKLAKRPHFAELKGEIIERLGHMRLESDHPAEVRAAALEVYNDLIAEKVLPGLSTKAQSQLLENLQQKAAASSTVNPGSAVPSTPKNVTSFHQLGADAWK